MLGAHSKNIGKNEFFYFYTRLFLAIVGKNQYWIERLYVKKQYKFLLQSSFMN